MAMNWLSGLSGLAKGAGSMLMPSEDSPYSGIYKDPRAYISGVGSLFGLYSNWQKQKAQEEAMRKYINAARAPITPNYAPMSGMEEAARRRAIKADLITRGIPHDSSYSTHLTAEGMAGHETDRWKFAMEQAKAERELQLRALGAKAGQQYAPSNTGAFGDYLNTLAMENQQRKTRDQMARIFGARQGQSPTGQADVSNLGIRDLQLGSMGQILGSDPSAYGDYQGAF